MVSMVFFKKEQLLPQAEPTGCQDYGASERK